MKTTAAELVSLVGRRNEQTTDAATNRLVEKVEDEAEACAT